MAKIINGKEVALKVREEIKDEVNKLFRFVKKVNKRPNEECISILRNFAEILKNDGILDVEALEHYIVEELNGIIGQEYVNVKANITFTE